MNIEDLVRNHVNFEGSSNNWNRTYCEVCGDGSRSKGPRGGWLFENNMCFYHCFNRGCEGNFDPTRRIAYSKGMREIFSAFNIPLTEVDKLVITEKINGNNSNTVIYTNTAFTTIHLPDYMYRLKEAGPRDKHANNAKKYLISRYVNPLSYEFYLSTGEANSDNPAEISNAKFLRNRIIIPAFRNDKIIYYIARDMDPNSKIKYFNVNIPKTNIIYGFDRLYQNRENPLFISEGVFDAFFHLNGIATLTNDLSREQIDIIEKSPRRKVIIPDIGNDSNKLLEKGIELGWGVCFAKFDDCKDINAAMQKYGKLHVLDKIMKNIKFTDSPRLMHLFLKSNKYF